MKKKVFISFDYDNDFELKNSLVAQSELADSPFSINDVSIQQALKSNWKEFARRKINESDIVIVICGKHTSNARGVSAELSMAQETGTPYFLLRGRPDGNVVKPLGARTDDKIYKWSWPNLKLLINGER